jgi:hypothetical protein
MATIEHHEFELDININGYADNPVVLDVAYTYHDPLPATDVDPPEPAKVEIMYAHWIMDNITTSFQLSLITWVAPKVWDEIKDEIIEMKQGIV